MDADQIRQLLVELNAELRGRQTFGEICIYGGAMMVLVHQAREATRDVDAIFEPSSVIRQAAARIAEQHGLRDDWLNDAVKGFVVSHARRQLFSLDHLKVFVPDTEYLLAMKAMSARTDATDADDLRLLIDSLDIKQPRQVFDIVAQYYPNERVKPATHFFIEELMASNDHGD